MEVSKSRKSREFVRAEFPWGPTVRRLRSRAHRRGEAADALADRVLVERRVAEDQAGARRAGRGRSGRARRRRRAARVRRRATMRAVRARDAAQPERPRAGRRWRRPPRRASPRCSRASGREHAPAARRVPHARAAQVALEVAGRDEVGERALLEAGLSRVGQRLGGEQRPDAAPAAGRGSRSAAPGTSPSRTCPGR